MLLGGGFQQFQVFYHFCKCSHHVGTAWFIQGTSLSPWTTVSHWLHIITSCAILFTTFLDLPFPTAHPTYFWPSSLSHPQTVNASSSKTTALEVMRILWHLDRFFFSLFALGRLWVLISIPHIWKEVSSFPYSLAPSLALARTSFFLIPLVQSHHQGWKELAIMAQVDHDSRKSRLNSHCSHLDSRQAFFSSGREWLQRKRSPMPTHMGLVETPVEVKALFGLLRGHAVCMGQVMGRS